MVHDTTSLQVNMRGGHTHTTPLMEAAAEGHQAVCALLLAQPRVQVRSKHWIVIAASC